MKVKCVLFDLDGTLLNTNKLVLESLKYTIKQVLKKDVDETSLYKYFGVPLVDIMRDLGQDKCDLMVKVYREHNIKKHDELTLPFPGVTETLIRLKEKSVLTAVVTSKLKGLALRGLGLFNLEIYFDACVAYEDTVQHKPDPAPILKALEALSLSGMPDQVLMIGDSPFDIECAKNAGVKSGAVQWSMHPKEVLMSYHPDIWLAKFSDLLNYV